MGRSLPGQNELTTRLGDDQLVGHVKALRGPVIGGIAFSKQPALAYAAQRPYRFLFRPSLKPDPSP